MPFRPNILFPQNTGAFYEKEIMTILKIFDEEKYDKMSAITGIIADEIAE